MSRGAWSKRQRERRRAAEKEARETAIDSSIGRVLDTRSPGWEIPANTLVYVGPNGRISPTEVKGCLFLSHPALDWNLGRIIREFGDEERRRAARPTQTGDSDAE